MPMHYKKRRSASSDFEEEDSQRMRSTEVIKSKGKGGRLVSRSSSSNSNSSASSTSNQNRRRSSTKRRRRSFSRSPANYRRSKHGEACETDNDWAKKADAFLSKVNQGTPLTQLKPSSSIHSSNFNSNFVGSQYALSDLNAAIAASYPIQSLATSSGPYETAVPRNQVTPYTISQQVSIPYAFSNQNMNVPPPAYVGTSHSILREKDFRIYNEKVSSVEEANTNQSFEMNANCGGHYGPLIQNFREAGADTGGNAVLVGDESGQVLKDTDSFNNKFQLKHEREKLKKLGIKHDDVQLKENARLQMEIKAIIATDFTEKKLSTPVYSSPKEPLSSNRLSNEADNYDGGKSENKKIRKNRKSQEISSCSSEENDSIVEKGVNKKKRIKKKLKLSKKKSKKRNSSDQEDHEQTSNHYLYSTKNCHDKDQINDCVDKAEPSITIMNLCGKMSDDYAKSQQQLKEALHRIQALESENEYLKLQLAKALAANSGSSNVTMEVKETRKVKDEIRKSKWDVKPAEVPAVNVGTINIEEQKQKTTPEEQKYRPESPSLDQDEIQPSSLQKPKPDVTKPTRSASVSSTEAVSRGSNARSKHHHRSRKLSRSPSWHESRRKRRSPPSSSRRRRSPSDYHRRSRYHNNRKHHSSDEEGRSKRRGYDDYGDRYSRRDNRPRERQGFVSITAPPSKVSSSLVEEQRGGKVAEAQKPGSHRERDRIDLDMWTTPPILTPKIGVESLKEKMRLREDLFITSSATHAVNQPDPQQSGDNALLAADDPTKPTSIDPNCRLSVNMQWSQAGSSSTNKLSKSSASNNEQAVATLKKLNPPLVGKMPGGGTRSKKTPDRNRFSPAVPEQPPPPAPIYPVYERQLPGRFKNPTPVVVDMSTILAAAQAHIQQRWCQPLGTPVTADAGVVNNGINQMPIPLPPLPAAQDKDPDALLDTRNTFNTDSTPDSMVPPSETENVFATYQTGKMWSASSAVPPPPPPLPPNQDSNDELALLGIDPNDLKGFGDTS